MIRLLARRIAMLCGIFGIWQEEKCLKSCLRGALKPKQQPKMVVNVVFGDGGCVFGCLARGCFCGSAVLPQQPPTGVIFFFVPIALSSVGQVKRNLSSFIHRTPKKNLRDFLSYNYACFLLLGAMRIFTKQKKPP